MPLVSLRDHVDLFLDRVVLPICFRLSTIRSRCLGSSEQRRLALNPNQELLDSMDGILYQGAFISQPCERPAQYSALSKRDLLWLIDVNLLRGRIAEKVTCSPILLVCVPS